MTQTFPPDLLHQPPADRLAWFRQKVIRHPHLDTAFQAVQDAIRAPAGATLILVIGATGIGKTTLRLRLERQLITEAQARMATDPGHIPVVSVEAIAPEQGTFNWRDYYLRALQALEEPLLEHKRPRPGEEPRTKLQRATTATVRQALEQCLQHCYAQSAGCVGVLKDWLNRALALALDASLPTLTPAVLEQASLALPTRLQLAREIQTGEAAFVTTTQQQAELHALLGIPPADEGATATPRSRRAGRRQQTRDTTSDAAEEPVC